MQNAKDSFYIALRDRLASLNPARTITLRSVQRPAIFVEEAEAPMAELLNDTFVLRWTATTSFKDMPSTLIGMLCEIRYATSGSQTVAGLDRGRALSELDRELLAILTPLYTQKVQFTTTAALPLETNVFWTEPVSGAAQTVRNQLLRTVAVTVFAFQEAGE